MPWDAGDASSKTRKANTPSKRSTWAKVANRTLRETGDEGRTVRIANYAVGRAGKRKDRSESKRSGRK